MRGCGESCENGENGAGGEVGTGMSSGGISGGSPLSVDDDADPIGVGGRGALCVIISGGSCRGVEGSVFLIW